ncbi:hypothetical protein WJX75_005148 [Coccomyxa subellipsoidea]|uniref:Ribosomal protein L13 n=1 Tax=Coccomyxa subellipsoidea TaxID=248742 RepID=A0ABR2YXK8_9CHLO
MSRLLRGIKTEGLRLRLVDAREQVVGRLASQLSTLLQGKDKPTYTPWKEEGDILIVTNAKHVVFTGQKWDQKLYRWHTGFPGGLKERTAKKEFEGDPTSILRRAVYGMLPKNKLRKERARKLRIYPGEEHPFADHPDLVPWDMPPRKRRIREALFELPEGYKPLNPTVYRKRFGHMLPAGDMSCLFEGEEKSVIPSAKSADSGPDKS